MKEINVNFSLADSEYMTALRLVAGSVLAANDRDVDVIEDFKVCVTESVIILKNCGFGRVSATFGTDGGVYCVVCGEGGEPRESENEFSLALVSALVADCSIERKNGVIGKVTLRV